MKIKNKENNIDILYVQFKDIKFINDYEKDCPSSLKEIYNLNNKDKIVNSMFSNFIRIDDEDLINYIDNLDYIIDYRVFKDINIKVLNEELCKSKEIINKLSSKFNDKDKNSNLELLYSRSISYYNDLSLISWIKKGRKFIDYPYAIDFYDSRCIKNDIYESFNTLDSFCIIIKKRDNDVFLEDENVNFSFLYDEMNRRVNEFYHMNCGFRYYKIINKVNYICLVFDIQNDFKKSMLNINELYDERKKKKLLKRKKKRK